LQGPWQERMAMSSTTTWRSLGWALQTCKHPCLLLHVWLQICAIEYSQSHVYARLYHLINTIQLRHYTSASFSCSSCKSWRFLHRCVPWWRSLNSNQGYIMCPCTHFLGLLLKLGDCHFVLSPSNHVHSVCDMQCWCGLQCLYHHWILLTFSCQWHFGWDPVIFKLHHACFALACYMFYLTVCFLSAALLVWASVRKPVMNSNNNKQLIASSQ
jgi:hypothetical protein